MAESEITVALKLVADQFQGHMNEAENSPWIVREQVLNLTP